MYANNQQYFLHTQPIIFIHKTSINCLRFIDPINVQIYSHVHKVERKQLKAALLELHC